MKTMTFDLHLPNPSGHLCVKDTAAGVNHRYAIDLHAPDFSKCDLLTDEEKVGAANELAALLDGKAIDAHPPSPIPDPTPEQLEALEWRLSDAEMTAKLARRLEDIYVALDALTTLPAGLKAELDPVVAARKAKRNG